MKLTGWRQSRWFPVALAVALVTGIVALARIALPAVGLFLLVADPLEPSDAIFLLEGGTPARELEAAALYRRGYAPVVVVVQGRDPIP